MRFSLNFIKEFLELKVPAKELATTLTMAGMEVEHLEKIGDDWALDIEITTNRYDWLSVLGVAREIGASTDKKLKVKYLKVDKKPIEKKRKIIIENKEDCPFYVGRTVRGVKPTASPAWLKSRVQNCGINSINNIVDITNYCMLKWGNPLHAFDEDKIEGDIYIRRAKKGEKFLGIDEKERILTGENLVIADSKKVIALAGVIGGKNTEVDENTKNIFLEAAIFSPTVTRRSRREACVDTESSYRFERRVSADCLEYASAESAQLIKELAKGGNASYIEAGIKPASKQRKITLEISKLNFYLGEEISKQKVKKILSNLGCTLKEVSKDKLSVSPCDFRFDLLREVDLYEEIARIYGYDKIQPKLPFLLDQREKDGSGLVVGADAYDFKKKLGKSLAVLGLREIVTFSIEGSEQLGAMGCQNLVGLLNPMRKQEDSMRPTLLLGMLGALRHNTNRGQKDLQLFEIANIYNKTKIGFSEETVISLGVAGESFFHLKGLIEEFLRSLNIGKVVLVDKKENNFTNALEILAGSKSIGFLGKLDSSCAQSFDLKTDIFFAQLRVEALAELKNIKKYKEFSLYPATSRDISVAMERSCKFQAIEKIVEKKAGVFFAGLEIVDRYRGKDLPKEQTAFTVRVFYQSKTQTLTSAEVDSLHNEIRKSLSQKEGVFLR
ncbi:MAG: phenylalanine--tRNA ligase subunit beta [Candidatus Omnitrophica bacterium]|nr:phenylalanine--tRNA ligase subunit beta [Candidatus Omnitrophota bacterium]